MNAVAWAVAARWCYAWRSKWTIKYGRARAGWSILQFRVGSRSIDRFALVAIDCGLPHLTLTGCDYEPLGF
jgi:hypothetical protein